MLAKSTTLLAAVEPMMTTSAVARPDLDGRPGGVLRRGRGGEGAVGVADRQVPEIVAGFASDDPTVDRSPNTLSKKYPCESRKLGPPKLNWADSTPRVL